MMWNISRVPVGLSAMISAPGSTLRAVITPRNGAMIFWNDCKSANCLTVASLA